MVRPYRSSDTDELWELKRAFELELGSGGDGTKARTYEEKLTEQYRDRYLSWVQRCVEENDLCVQVADGDEGLVGYVFVLPESLAHIWDGAVLNELFVVEHARGTGLGNELVEAAIAVAREQSLPLDRLLLDVDESNERARAFYERHGFEHWGEMVSRPL